MVTLPNPRSYSGSGACAYAISTVRAPLDADMEPDDGGGDGGGGYGAAPPAAASGPHPSDESPPPSPTARCPSADDIALCKCKNPVLR